MSQKLICIVPSIGPLNEAVALLRQAGLEDDAISVVGPQSSISGNLPDAGTFENDAIPAAVRGAATGGTTGVIAGLAVTAALPGLVLGGPALLLAAAGGASFGMLASTLIGASVPNSQIREYEQAVERGEFLLVAELPDEQFETVRHDLQSRIRGIKIEGTVEAIPPVI